MSTLNINHQIFLNVSVFITDLTNLRNTIKNILRVFLPTFEQTTSFSKMFESLKLANVWSVRTCILNKSRTSMTRLHLSVNYARSTLETACTTSRNHDCIIYITPLNAAINVQALRCQFTMQSSRIRFQADRILRVSQGQRVTTTWKITSFVI